MGIRLSRHGQRRLNRDVALEGPAAELTTDAGRRERFIREARAASALEHPNIAVIHDVGDEDGVSFIAMELIRGDKLSAPRFNSGYVAQSPGRAIEIAVEVAEGAGARAQPGHRPSRSQARERDAAPKTATPRVIDFGLAKLLAPLDYSGGNTATMSAPRRKWCWAPCRTCRRSRRAAARSITAPTVFSFGILLYEMFSGGTLPFKGRSSIETMHAILHDPPPPLHLHGLALPQAAAQDVQRIIDKCLAQGSESPLPGHEGPGRRSEGARRRMDSDAVASRPACRCRPLDIGSPRAGSRWLIGRRTRRSWSARGYWFIPRSTHAVAEATGSRPVGRRDVFREQHRQQGNGTGCAPASPTCW
jgi:serine/threonine protein kinase